MTKVKRWLGGAGLAVALSMLLLGLGGSFSATGAAAESPPAPPARFVGTVRVDGQNAAPGTVITAYVGSQVCKVTQVSSVGTESRYTLDVPALDPGASPNCGTDGAAVTFYIGDKKAAETGTWRNYDINVLNLTYTTPTPTPPGAPSVTPAPPRTGELGGSGSGDSAAVWLFAALGLGALAFGVGGAAVARRGR